MAVVVTAASGYDLGYIWTNQPDPGQIAGGYYLNAALSGEPPGRWWGPGARALGFTDGQLVDRAPYELVYRQQDPRTGQKLGRAPGRYATFDDHLARLTAAEPHATAERLLELERQAAQATRQAPAYIDLTVSFSKSISILHASIRENERRARIAGRLADAERWAAADATFQEILHAANRAGLDYAQRHAGITRTGYHGTRVHGQEPGRFEEAELIVTSWLQGTSRDGDPQDHIHNQIARLVRTTRDGKYRALDTVCLRQVLPAVRAVVATHAECGLTRAFGVTWEPRADGAGNEIAGIAQEQIGAYSTRTASITGHLAGAVASWTAKYGRQPTSRELLHIRQDVTLASRTGKDPGVIDWDAVTARWDARLGGELAAIAPRVSHLPARAHGAADPGNDPEHHAAPLRSARAPAAARPRITWAALTRAIQRALARVQAAQATWTRADLLGHLAAALPPATRNLPPDHAVALLHELAGQAVAGTTEQVICLDAPQWPPLPASLIRDVDGRSVYTRPGITRYATRVQLTLEEQLLQDAQRTAAPHLSRDEAAALLGYDPAALETALHDQLPETGIAAGRPRPAPGPGRLPVLGADQRPGRRSSSPARPAAARPGSRRPPPGPGPRPAADRSSASPPPRPPATSSPRPASPWPRTAPSSSAICPAAAAPAAPATPLPEPCCSSTRRR